MMANKETKESLSPIWKGVGCSLEEVEIGCPYSDEYLDLLGLSRHCENVTKLSFGWAVDHEPVVDHCVRYGSGLKQLDIGGNIFAAK